MDRIRRRTRMELRNGMKELAEAFGIEHSVVSCWSSAKRVRTTARDTRRSLLGNTIVVLLRYRATYRVITSSYHYAPSPPQVITGANSRHRRQPFFLPFSHHLSLPAVLFICASPSESHADSKAAHNHVSSSGYYSSHLNFRPTMPRLPSSPETNSTTTRIDFSESLSTPQEPGFRLGKRLYTTVESNASFKVVLQRRRMLTLSVVIVDNVTYGQVMECESSARARWLRYPRSLDNVKLT